MNTPDTRCTNPKCTNKRCVGCIAFAPKDTPDIEWAEQIMDLGVQVNTVQDGDARYREYTFNEAQLEAFITSRDTYWKERVEGLKYEREHSLISPLESNRHEDIEYGFNQAKSILLDNLK